MMVAALLLVAHHPDPNPSTPTHRDQTLLAYYPLLNLRLDLYHSRQWDLYQVFGSAIGCALAKGCTAQRQDHSIVVFPNGFSSSCESPQR